MAQVASEVGEALQPELGSPAAAIVGKTPWQLFWARFRKDKFALAGLVVIGILVLIAVGAGFISENIVKHGQNELFLYENTDQYGLPEGPTGEFWFGADTAGRDLFVRTIFGARTSLIVAFLATGISVVIGVVIGVVAGFYGGKIDTFLSRVTDLFMSLPILLLALGLVSACGASKEGCAGGLIKPGLLLVSYVIGFFNWPYIARIVRGQVLSLREKEFIEAARAQGSGDFRIMSREVLPNIVAPIIVYTTLIIPNNIIFEASLSFLGAGVPPSTPSWGKMLSDAAGIFTVAWWMMLFPGLFLFLTTLSFNLVGDGLRDALDPKSAR